MTFVLFNIVKVIIKQCWDGKKVKEKIAVVLAVVRLLDKWQLTDSDKMTILGMSSKSKLDALLKSPQNISKMPDFELRLSLLLNIHEELRLTFKTPDNVYGYMTMINHNSPYLGQRPIDLAIKNIQGLRLVYISTQNIITPT